MVNEEKNHKLTTMPTLEEFNVLVFSMNPTSAVCLDSMNGYFFLKCCHIIKQDLMG